MEKDEINKILKNGLPITREDSEPTDEDLIAEQAVIGWVRIWKVLFHADSNGKRVPLFSLQRLMVHHGPELRRCGVIFKWYSERWKTPKTAAWPTMARRWITKKSQLKEL